ncbi:MAG TPA: sulfatase-like hydrolase/transferase, partial [Candidatus Saccharimonadales bacterium]|nr:sulfatase-like hydrolase/transferase [Candidatus Saccharimonadales bacterium]
LSASVLLILNLYPLVKYWATNYGLANTPFGPQIKVVDKSEVKKPDIYYLVFDRYANEKVLKDVYNFDNSPFLNLLKDKGFYVASDSTANYPFTTFSLAMSLNLGYVPNNFKNRPDSGLYYTVMKDKLENNKAALFLKGQGYKFVNIGPWWTATKYNKNADLDLYDPSGLVLLNKKIDLKEHELILFQDTIFWPFFSKLPTQVGPYNIFGLTFPSGKESSSRVIHRQTILHQFDSLKKMAREPGPKFVFSHMLFPHDPYVFDKSCNAFRSRYTDEYTVYLDQLKCTNTKIQQIVDYILSNSDTKPIIIIQSDEGPYPKAFRQNRDLNWGDATLEMLQQKAEILNAYYFPDKNYSKLYQSISPVNSFRVIFDQYFGTDLGLIEDKHYFPESEKRRFFLLDMTDKFDK